MGAVQLGRRTLSPTAPPAQVLQVDTLGKFRFGRSSSTLPVAEPDRTERQGAASSQEPNVNLRPPLSTFKQCRLILRAASWIVPSELRRQWLQEWEAEVAHHWNQISQPGTLNAKHGTQLRLRCLGAFWDAAWFRLNRKDLERTIRHLGRSPSYCLFLSLCMLILVAVSSGLLSRTRSIFFPAPYAIANRVVTISRTARVESSEWAVPYSWVKVWKSDGRIFDEIAGYRWEPGEETLTAADRRFAVPSVQVEDNFFNVFGVNAKLGRTFQPKDSQGCSDCVVVSYSAWQNLFRGDNEIVGQKIRLNGKEAAVLGVLPEKFWFPSRDVAIWRVVDGTFAGPNANVGVAGRLRQGVGKREARSVLERLVTQNAGDQLVGFDLEIWGVQERVREPLILYIFLLGIVLLVTSALVWSGHMAGSMRAGRVMACRWWTFFAVKTSFLLVSLLAAVVEFTPAPYVIRTSGITFPLESASPWIFTVGCMGILWWSFNDQQSRCRECMHRLVLPIRIGNPGCLLLSWGGMELVCEKGHGVLHVTEADYCCWLEYRQWIQFDDSWKSLFVGSEPYQATRDAA